MNEIYKKALEAVRHDWTALAGIRYQTHEICKAAVSQNGRAILYVWNQTHDLCMEAVQHDGMALAHIHKQTKELCEAAVEQNAQALQWVLPWYQTEALCRAAVKKDRGTLKFVRDPELFEKLQHGKMLFWWNQINDRFFKKCPN